MKRSVSVLIGMLMSFSLIFISGSAWAAPIAEVSAELKNVQFTGLTANMTPENASVAYAETRSTYDEDYMFGSTDTSASADVGAASNQSAVTAGVLSSSSKAEAAVGDFAWGDGWSDFIYTFDVVAGTTVGMTADYILDMALDGSGGIAAGWADAYLAIGYYDDVSDDYDLRGEDYLFDIYFTDGIYGNTLQGSLSVSYDFLTDGIGYLYGGVYSDAWSETPVPEPSTLLLFWAGALGLVCVGRKKYVSGESER